MAGSEEELDWDADDFDPEAGFATKKDNPEWEGEDEGIEPEILKVESTPTPASDAPKKPSKQERIEEKKAKRRAEELAKKAHEEQTTIEDKLAEKLRLEQAQKDADLEVAKSLFGVSSGSIDSMHPTTPEQFDELKDALRDKLLPLEISPHYIGFLDNLLRTVCVGLDVEDLRKLSSTLNHLANEKQKATKATKGKKKTKVSLGTAGKAAKKADQITRLDDYNDELGAEYDDFM